ncbi:MAG: glutamine--tRNA ligase/YqeY domain fusion protein [Lentisphaeria bacterium]|nr:glutamine--tRNA ligase/YqeY domain fusion protein [Lentisphaeria bacterium]NQZ66881.1 glutamine--tRNA ligase/YqeY domain fusion protein [Lentisphaeria bacterium]
MSEEEESDTSRHFIRQIIEADLANKKNDGAVVTRFPPEPNGYLHIGHAKSMCLNFGMAEKFDGRCHLRFDDTNPEKESVEFVDSIKADISWLGFTWNEHEYYASDYYDHLYELAAQLIKDGKAYACTLDIDEFKEYRGTPSEPGTNSPSRDRSIEENAKIFAEMKNGEHQEGDYVIRAKIDMTHDNIHMRDPVIYRIRYTSHYRTGDTWCLYPMYDFTHCLSDAKEGVTHSLCTMEFEVHRPLYDWFIKETNQAFVSEQTEFARLNMTYTVLSKRKLQLLVEGNHVDGWEDPRMPTLSGLRRRGYTPEAIRNFCDKIGISKFNSLTDVSLLEHCLRDDLNASSPRTMAVLNPLKLVITNYPEGEEENFTASLNQNDPDAGTRDVTFSRTLYIEREDFMEDPPKKFFRMGPGREVRLRYACLVTCTDVIKDDAGNIMEIHAEWDPESRGGSAPDGRKVKGTIHWVSEKHSVDADVYLYDRLFNVEQPDGDKDVDFIEHLNPESLSCAKAKIPTELAKAEAGSRFQLERLGYFCIDINSTEADVRINRTVPLRDSWAKK